MPRETKLFDNLHHYLSNLPVIDCHEHTNLPDQRPRPVDLWALLRDSDLGDDLISAGMPAAVRPKLDWEHAASFLPKVRNTGFFQSLLIAFRRLFDFTAAEITEDNWPALSQNIQAANERSDWYEEVLRRRANIRRILRVQGAEKDPYAVDGRYFSPLIKFDDWVLATKAEEREKLAQSVGGAARSLDEYLDALTHAFEAARSGGAVGIKSLLAYRRTLLHARPTKEEIAPLFARTELTGEEARAFEDFMCHALAERAGEFGLPFQIHVGYGSWQRNIVADANPVLLNPLIENHRNTHFVLLHGGYPFIGEMATLAKNHPNAYLECGWLAYIAPAAYRRAMGEWLDSVPANKLLAFSADCVCIEQTFGALLFTRRLLAQALAEKIEQDGWTESLAQNVAGRLMAQNAVELYQLKAAPEKPSKTRAAAAR